MRPIDGEQICENCGLVVDSTPIDHGKEWRGGYDPEREQRVRTKAGNRTLIDRGLGSHFAPDGGDRDAARRARLHHRIKNGDKTDRNRGYATTEIQRIGTALGLDDTVLAQGKRLFRELHEDAGQGGRDLDTLAAAALYGATRVHQRGLAPGDVAAVARTDALAISRRWNTMQTTLGVPVPPPDPRQRIRVVAREADVSAAARERAVSALDGLTAQSIANGSPSTLAAVLLWLASEQTQAEVAEAAGVTPTGLRKRWHRLGDVPVADAD